MKVIRWVLGRLILLFDFIFSPIGTKRTDEEQIKINNKTIGLSLYQYKACPFCVKVRRALKRKSLIIPAIDIKRCETSRKELINHGGKLKVPCLKIEKPGENIQWLYESSAIINYIYQSAGIVK